MRAGPVLAASSRSIPSPAALSEAAVVPFPVVLAAGRGQDASAGIPQPQPAQTVLFLSSPPPPWCCLLTGHQAAREGRQGIISVAVLLPH